MTPSPKLEAFTPSDVSHPGESLQEMLSDQGMTQIELASRLGLDKKTINQIIQGKASITHDTALGLERVFGVPALFWLNLENQFQIAEARKVQAAEAEQYKTWMSQFPYRDMVKRNWVPKAGPKAYGEKVLNLLEFFGVSTPDGWREIYEEKDLGLAYRRSPKVSVKTHAISAWLREGERKASKLSPPGFDEEAFRKALKEIRKLTLVERFEDFYPLMQKHCSDAGVNFLVVKELPGVGINGVTRWFSGRPMIQQGFRMKWNDQFWFTFFHEAGHVLQNRRKQVFIDAKGIQSDDRAREDEADRFAAEFLIPEKAYNQFLISCADEPSIDDIEQFADDIEIHPGILVGRLMRDEILEYSDPALGLKCKFGD